MMKKNHICTKSVVISLMTLILFSISGVKSAHSQSSGVESVQFNIPDSHLTGGFALGAQAYTFNRFTIFEAIEMTAKAGGRVIELFPGQRLETGDDSPRFNHDSSDEVIARVKQKLDEHDLIVVNYGNVSLPNDEEELRKVFELAKKLGVKAVTSEPSAEAMDLIEKMVKEYNIALAIHNHPPRENNPDYNHWNPDFIFGMIEGRDPRVGVSADIGHYIRSNIDPIEVLQQMEGRIVSMHFTDVDQWGADGKDTVAGTGVADLPAILSELKRQNFGGNISIEFETNWDENITDVAQFIGFVRGWAEASI